jgi:uncharacterized protein YwqG
VKRLRRWLGKARGGARPSSAVRERSDVRSLALEEGLDARSAEALAAVALPSLRLRPTAGRRDHFETRLGGPPLLPVPEEWPRVDGRPLAYVGQLYLPDTGADGASLGLPTDGMLTFFYDASGQPWGFDPADRGGWRVDWRTDLDGLSIPERPHDLDPSDRFTAVPMQLELEWTVPGFDAYEVDDLSFGSEDQERVQAVADRLTGDLPAHRVLGHPDLIQSEMRLECEVVSRGIYFGGDRGEVVIPPDAERAARDWRLLLQVDSDGDVGTEWGDVGRIYFWIRAADLQARDFSHVHLSLQCF